MKPIVDIFRPLAAAKRVGACRPSGGDSTSSIFRRNNNQHHRHQHPMNMKSNSAESEGFVVSVPPGQWPPHQALSISSTSEGTATQKKLDRCAPLPTGTQSSDCSSPLSASRNSTRSPSKKNTSTTVTVTPPPSYYKIELLVQGSDGSGDGDGNALVQLTAGDDSSVQLTPDHNEQLQLVNHSAIDGSARQAAANIIRASPVIEHEAIEATESSIHDHDVKQKHHESSLQRWTISDNGNIIIVPPSPSRVSTTHNFSKKPRHSIFPPSGDDENDDTSIPPLLVKASNSSSDDSFLSTSSENELNPDGMEMEEMELGGENLELGDSESLESPPRMNRSMVTPSLFQDSVSSKGSRSSSNNNGKRAGMASTSNNGKSRSRSNSPSSGQTRGGCGTRPLDFLSQMLDVFSLNGGCCHQSRATKC